MRLADVFASAAYKRLAQVDVPESDARSNQHEITANLHIRALFEGLLVNDEYRGEITWITLVDDQDPAGVTSWFTFYDTRRKDPKRAAEWRLYYPGDVLDHMRPGDAVVLARTRGGRFVGLLMPHDSAWLEEIESLFGFKSAYDLVKFQAVDQAELQGRQVGIREQILLDEIGLEDEVVESSSSDDELVNERFSDTESWPTVAEMVEFAQSLSDEIDDDDAQLMAWLSREADLFRALEYTRVAPVIERGFIGPDGRADIDEFARVSLSIQNRRKSRMGGSFEGHLAAILRRRGLTFSEQSVTEGHRKPDFILPGIDHYRRAEVGDPNLTMLGAKSTCKDRWRQVLTEAAKIPDKHLCTLEVALSGNQVDEMVDSRVTLVLPAMGAVTPRTFRNAMNLAEFVEMCRFRQAQFS